MFSEIPRALLCKALGLVLALGGVPAGVVAQPTYIGPSSSTDKKPASFPDVEPEVRTARGDFDAAIAGRRDQGAARKNLRRAEDRLNDALKSNPTSRPAAELLGQVYYYQGELGDKGGYERCTRFLE